MAKIYLYGEHLSKIYVKLQLNFNKLSAHETKGRLGSKRDESSSMQKHQVAHDLVWISVKYELELNFGVG